jgi:hypothetical protein
MGYRVEIESKTTVELDVELVAKWFCELDDEKQADFFIQVAKRAKGWERDQGHQWWLVGRHLVNCICGTTEALDLVAELSYGIQSAKKAPR